METSGIVIHCIDKLDHVLQWSLIKKHFANTLSTKINCFREDQFCPLCLTR